MPDEFAPQPFREPHSPDAAAGENPPEGALDRRKLRLETLRGVLAFLVIGILLPIFIFAVFHRWISPNFKELSLHAVLPFELIQAFCVVLATWVASLFVRRPMANLGLPPGQALGARFWEGAVWGFAMLSFVLLVLHALGDFQFGAAALYGPAAWKYALGWAVFFLAVGVYEECFFRGYFLFALARRLGFWYSALLLSAAFAAGHLGNSGENAFGILQVFVIGMVFCLTIRRTGSLWFAIGLHTSWDWAQTFFYGTPDSGLLGVGHYLNSTSCGSRWLTGGSAGPEGSVLAFVVILLAAGLIHLRFPDAKYPDRPA